MILKKLGYEDAAGHRASGFHFDGDYFRWAQKNGPPAWWTDLRIGRPAAVVFWYRSSPDALAPSSPAGRVTARDPPALLPGMQQVFLDTAGRLIEFHAVPPAIALDTPAPDAPWPALFEAADLDARAFTPLSPKWLPPVFADAAAAWEGPIPGRADMRVRIEAASYKNHPVSFQIVWPWTEPPRSEASQRTALQRLTDATSIAFWLAMLAGAVLLARRNLRANRSDRRGAARLGIGMTVASIALNVLNATHVADPNVERMQVFGALAFGVFNGGMVWIYYLAIEPYARRFWPDALLGWTRLLSGHVRDPRVGRELLIGLLFGGVGLLIDLSKLVPMALGWRIPGLPMGNDLQYFDGVASVGAQWLEIAIGALMENDEVVAFKSGPSSTLFVYRSSFAGTNKATAVTFVAAEVDELVRTLKSRGVTFEHYDLPKMTRQGDIHVAGSMGLKEETVHAIGFNRLAVFRPGIIGGNVHTPGYVAWLGRLIPGRFGTIEQDDIARAFVAEFINSVSNGVVYFENGAMRHQSRALR